MGNQKLLSVSKRTLTRRQAMSTMLAGTAGAALLGSRPALAQVSEFPAMVSWRRSGGFMQFSDGTQLIVPRASVFANRTIIIDKWYPEGGLLWDGTELVTEVLKLEVADGGPQASNGAPVVIILPKLVQQTVATAMTLRQNRSFPDPDTCVPRPDKNVFAFGQDKVMYHLDAIDTSAVVIAES